MATAKNQDTFAFEQAQFGGGVVTVRDARLIGEDQYARSLNCRPDPTGRVMKRLGYTEQYDLELPEGTVVRASRWIVTEAGFRYLLVWYDDTVIVYDPDAVAPNEVTVLATGLAEGTRLAHEEWSNRIYFSDGVNGLWYFEAPDADVAAFVYHVLGTYPAERRLKFTAATAGSAGNGLTVEVLIDEVTDTFEINAEGDAKPTPTGKLMTEIVDTGPGVVECIVHSDAQAWNRDQDPVSATDSYYITSALEADDDTVPCQTNSGVAKYAAGNILKIIGIAGTFEVASSSTDGTTETIVLTAPLGVAVPLGHYIVLNSGYDPIGWEAVAIDVTTVTYTDVQNALNEADVSIKASACPAEQVTAFGPLTLAYGADSGVLQVIPATEAYSFTYLCARPASERLFGIDAADTTNLRWCQAFDAASWSGDIANVYSPGGNFTAIADAGETIVAMTRNEVYRIDGSDPTTWRATKVKSDGLGCVAPGSVSILEGVPVWLSVRGLVYFDGDMPKLLSSDVFKADDPDRSIVPARDGVLADGDYLMTAVQTPGLYMLFYDTTKAVVHDFHLGGFGGEYEFGMDVACTASHLGSDLTMVSWIVTPLGVIAREEGHTDLGDPITMLFGSRDIDGGRVTLDKIFNDLRVAVEADADINVVLRFIAEDENGVRYNADTTENQSSTFVTAGGAEMFRKRLRNTRCRFGHVECEAVGDGEFALVGEAVEFFFVRAR